MSERFTLQIDMGNDAFSEYPATELANILQGIAARIQAGDFPVRVGVPAPVRDGNGNRVGEWRIEP